AARLMTAQDQPQARHPPLNAIVAQRRRQAHLPASAPGCHPSSSPPATTAAHHACAQSAAAPPAHLLIARSDRASDTRLPCRRNCACSCAPHPIPPHKSARSSRAHTANPTSPPTHAAEAPNLAPLPVASGSGTTRGWVARHLAQLLPRSIHSQE